MFNKQIQEVLFVKTQISGELSSREQDWPRAEIPGSLGSWHGNRPQAGPIIHYILIYSTIVNIIRFARSPLCPRPSETPKSSPAERRPVWSRPVLCRMPSKHPQISTMTTRRKRIGFVRRRNVGRSRGRRVSESEGLC